MIGLGGCRSVVNIQVGYCISDIISKCGVGLLIYQISYEKSKQEIVKLQMRYETAKGNVKDMENSLNALGRRV